MAGFEPQGAPWDGWSMPPDPRTATFDQDKLFPVDPQWYSQQYPDIGNYPAADHYQLEGKAEGRLPNADALDSAFYLKQNQDVASQGVDPLWHYLVFGKNEGRAPNSITPGQQPTPIPNAPVSDPTSAESWGAYRQQAANATAGINRIPFMFSDSGSVPMNHEAAMAMMYPEQAMRLAMQKYGAMPAAQGVTNLGMGSPLDPNQSSAAVNQAY
jgi:hypothetical protein